MPKSCPKCGGPMPSRHTGNCAGCVLDNVNEARRIAGVILGDAPPPKPPKAFTETITSFCTDSYTQGRSGRRVLLVCLSVGLPLPHKVAHATFHWPPLDKPTPMWYNHYYPTEPILPYFMPRTPVMPISGVKPMSTPREPHLSEFPQSGVNAILSVSVGIALLLIAILWSYLGTIASLKTRLKENEADIDSLKATTKVLQETLLQQMTSPVPARPLSFDHDRPPTTSPELRMQWNQKKIDEYRQKVLAERKTFELLIEDQERMTALKQRLDEQVRQPLPDVNQPSHWKDANGVLHNKYGPISIDPTKLDPDPLGPLSEADPNDKPLLPSTPRTLLDILPDPMPLESPNDEPTKNKVPSPPPR